ncbi:hypothetical protein HJ134_14880 [Vibrio parahaemolyticus]|nr:hypothetical protein [Vibrio parahaemolyticus]
MRLNKCISFLIVIYLGFPVSADDFSKDGLDRAQDYAIKVVESCKQYGLESAKKIMQAMPPAMQQQNKAVLEDYYDGQIKICLQLYALKLQQAADSIE